MAEGGDVPGRTRVGLCEQRFSLRRASLLHQVDREIETRVRLVGCQLERTAEMPFARGQIVQLRQDRAEQVVSLCIARVDAQRDARELLGVAATAACHQDLDQPVVGPVGAGIDRDHRAQGFGGARHVTLAVLDEVTQLQRLQIARIELEKRFGRCGRGGHVAALERRTRLQDQGMRGGRHFHYSAGFSRACLPPAPRTRCTGERERERVQR